jgi:hypothetical protein
VRKFYCLGLVSDFLQEKLLSKLEGPYVIEEVYRSGAIKIASLKDDTTQVVNGQRLKHYIAGIHIMKILMLFKRFLQKNSSRTICRNLQSSFSNR